MSTNLNFLNNNERFHVFSKSPISNDLKIGQTVNKSGHTVTASDIWAQEIPCFKILDTVSDAISFAKYTKVNDLIKIGSVYYKRTDEEWTTDKTDEDFGDLWGEPQDFSTKNTYALQNSNGETVILWHRNTTPKLLTIDNNSNQSSFLAVLL